MDTVFWNFQQIWTPYIVCISKSWLTPWIHQTNTNTLSSQACIIEIHISTCTKGIPPSLTLNHVIPYRTLHLFQLYWTPYHTRPGEQYTNSKSLIQLYCIPAATPSIPNKSIICNLWHNLVHWLKSVTRACLDFPLWFITWYYIKKRLYPFMVHSLLPVPRLYRNMSVIPG